MALTVNISPAVTRLSRFSFFCHRLNFYWKIYQNLYYKKNHAKSRKLHGSRQACLCLD